VNANLREILAHVGNRTVYLDLSVFQNAVQSLYRLRRYEDEIDCTTGAEMFQKSRRQGKIVGARSVT
jgi:hypothetical protein